MKIENRERRVVSVMDKRAFFSGRERHDDTTTRAQNAAQREREREREREKKGSHKTEKISDKADIFKPIPISVRLLRSKTRAPTKTSDDDVLRYTFAYLLDLRRQSRVRLPVVPPRAWLPRETRPSRGASPSRTRLLPSTTAVGLTS